MLKKKGTVPQIVEFRKEEASKLAELFNSFDKEGLWPGGFTGGVPFTEERILDSFPVKTKSIVVLISTINGRFTGICSLHPHWEDEEAAYIGVLGVHPDFIGKGHGKALILESLRRAAENQLKRVDLHTWAGNLRAVPLYKKCGLYWVPETSVYMQSYVPAIVEFPFAKEFFKKHEWYSSQVRRLDLTPDDFKLGEMEIFPYEFASNKDHLKVWVDRYGRGILGLELTLQGEHFRVLAKLGKHKIISGVEENLEIEILNTKKIVTGSVFLSGFEGLNFTSRPQQSFKIETGKSLKLKTKFMIHPETSVPHVERKQKSIKANLVINGKLIPLEIGMRIMPLLEFKTYPESITVTPGTTGKIQFNLFNNSKKHLKGTIFLVDEQGKLNLNRNTISFDSAPESHTGFQVGIKVPKEQPTSVIPLKLSAQGTIGSSVVEAKSHVVYIRCLRSGGIVTWTEETKQGKEVFVENQELLSHLRLREGLLNITYKNTLSGRRNVLNAARTEVGPPYGFMKPINFEYRIIHRSDGLEVVLWGMHPDKSGLRVIETIKFHSGTPLIERKIQVVNMDPHVTHRLNARFSRTRSGRARAHRMIIPLDEILEHEMVGFPVSDNDLPTDPEAFRESWLCLQNKAEDYCFGQIWSKDKLVKVQISDTGDVTPEYALGEIKPGQSASTPRFIYVLERGEWHNIRMRWRQLMGKKLHIEEEVAQARPLLDIKTATSIILNRNMLKTQLKLVNRRSKAVKGFISIKPPKGWRIKPSKISFEQVTSKTPFTANISILPSKDTALGVYSGEIRLSTENKDYIYPMYLCLLGDSTKSPIQIKHVKEQDKDCFQISNGFLNYKVSADFAGCLYFMAKDNINQLGTSFPTIKTHVFLENYSGGIRPVYLGERFDFQKSKTHTEKFTAKSFTENFWKGVKLSYRCKMQEEIRDLQGAVSYLTLPQSNIIKIKRVFKNPTKASFDFIHYLWISPNIGRDFSKNIAIIPQDDKIIRCKRAKGAAMSFADRRKGWVLIRNDDKDLGLALIVGNTWKSSILSLDMGKTLLELFVMSRVQLKPGQTCELEDYALLTNDNFNTVDRLSMILRTR